MYTTRSDWVAFWACDENLGKIGIQIPKIRLGLRVSLFHSRCFSLKELHLIDGVPLGTIEVGRLWSDQWPWSVQDAGNILYPRRPLVTGKQGVGKCLWVISSGLLDTRCFIAKESLGGHVQVGTTEVQWVWSNGWLGSATVRAVSRLHLYRWLTVRGKEGVRHCAFLQHFQWTSGHHGLVQYARGVCWVWDEKPSNIGIQIPKIRFGVGDLLFPPRCFGLKELHLGGHVTLGIFEVQRPDGLEVI